jgi:hypothetical protein
MSPEDLETLLDITLGSKVASEVMWEANGDPYASAEALKQRAVGLLAPYRSHHGGKGYGTARKDAHRMQLVARVIDEVIYDFDEELDVELARSA